MLSASIYLVNLGFINLILLWPVWLILNLSKVESYTFNEIPFVELIFSSLSSLSFNALINFG